MTATPLQRHQQRVVDEKLDLDTKLENLHAFILGPQSSFHTLGAEDRLLLISQRDQMQAYSLTLQKRLALWGVILPFDTKFADLEVAFQALYNRAYDGEGRAVVLYPRGVPPALDTLRNLTRGFASGITSSGVMFVNGLGAEAMTPEAQRRAEAAAMRNLALLANATAAALDAGTH